MSEKLKVQVQDENGNIFYIHTSADIVFCEDGTSVETKLGQKIDFANIVQNATTAATDKIPSAAVAKNLQDQITQQNTKIENFHGSIMVKYTNPYSVTFSAGYVSQKVAINNIPDGYVPVAVIGLNFASTFFTMIGDGAITDNNTSFWMSARHILQENYSGTVQITALIMYVKAGLL